ASELSSSSHSVRASSTWIRAWRIFEDLPFGDAIGNCSIRPRGARQLFMQGEKRVSEEIIYTMKGVSKVYPPSRYVLKDIYLSYFYGAKIGVLGLNGSGKSSLLRILSGVDEDF